MNTLPPPEKVRLLSDLYGSDVSKMLAEIALFEAYFFAKTPIEPKSYANRLENDPTMPFDEEMPPSEKRLVRY